MQKDMQEPESDSSAIRSNSLAKVNQKSKEYAPGVWIQRVSDSSC